MATNWDNVPLPAGWEAKYDPGQTRYFFINHSTRETSWEDPRIKAYQQQQAHHQYQQQVEDKYNLKVTTIRDDDESESEEETPLVQPDEKKAASLLKMFPAADESLVKQLLVSNQNVDGLVVSELQQMGFKRQDTVTDHTLIANLCREFPNADQAVVRSLLKAVHNDEGKAREELREMGYKQHVPTSHGSMHHAQQVAAHKRPSGTSARGGSQSPARGATPQRTATISESEKARVKEKLSHDFKNVAGTVIEMAMEACQFNEAKCRAILESMGGNDKPTAKTSASSSRETRERSATPSSSSSRPETGTVSASSVAVTFPEVSALDIPSPPKPSSSWTIDTRTSALSDLLKHKKESSPLRKTSPPKATAASYMVEPRKRERRTRSPGKRTAAQRGTQKVTGAYMSTNRGSAQGPDPSLAIGPDRDLLINQYAHDNGPNREFRSGPKRGNRSGGSSAAGPDRSYREGPNPNNRCGPNDDFVKGSMYARRPLVSSV